jgi:hypothetical protein
VRPQAFSDDDGTGRAVDAAARENRMDDPTTDTTRNIPQDAPLNGPDVPLEEMGRELAGDRPTDEQAAFDSIDGVQVEGGLSDTEVYEGYLAAEGAAAGEPRIESLTELELQDGTTDDPNVAAEEGVAYVAPTDPPIVPSDSPEDAEVAAGMGSTSRDEPYDADHHSELLTSDDEMTARVREALRADAATSLYADDIDIQTADGIVLLRGEVDDVETTDDIAAVAQVVDGVTEVRDELEVRGL